MNDWGHPSVDLDYGQAFDFSHVGTFQVDLHHRFVVTLLFGCNKPRQCVCPCVVFSVDVLHRYLLESNDEVGDRVVAPLQQGSFTSNSPFT